MDKITPEMIEANTIGGQRFTQRDDPYPIHEYQLAHPIRAGQEFEELRAFFWVIGGSADAFRFKDCPDASRRQAVADIRKAE